MKLVLGLTRFRRGLQSRIVHTEASRYLVNKLEKKVIANDDNYALAA